MCLLYLGSHCSLSLSDRTKTHTSIHIYFLYFCIWIYIKNHGFIWILPTPIKKTGFILTYSLIYNCFIQQWELDTFIINNIFTYLFNLTIHKTVSEFLPNTSVRNTFTTEYNIRDFLPFSIRVHNNKIPLSKVTLFLSSLLKSVRWLFICSIVRFIC